MKFGHFGMFSSKINYSSFFCKLIILCTFLFLTTATMTTKHVSLVDYLIASWQTLVAVLARIHLLIGASVFKCPHVKYFQHLICFELELVEYNCKTNPQL